MKQLLFTFTMTFCFNLFASEQFEIISHQKVQRFIELKLKEYSSSDILVVFDIDNTILAMDGNFGSDQWFQWQKEELNKQSEFSIAKDFTELLEVQNEIFSLAKMHITEKSLLNLIPSLQHRKITTMALTSRGPNMRNNTEKELRRNGLSFKPYTLGYSIGSSFQPTAGSRLASYQDGIFMTSGMHKGEMLKYLLQRFNKDYRCIIFIDDHTKHTSRVFETFERHSDINTFRYGHEDKKVNMFKKSNKERSVKLGKAFIELRNNL